MPGYTRLRCLSVTTSTRSAFRPKAPLRWRPSDQDSVGVSPVALASCLLWTGPAVAQSGAMSSASVSIPEVGLLLLFLALRLPLLLRL